MPFLVHLKGHLNLMSVQVCLGGIDGWLLEHNDTHSFLESSFGSTINATVMKELQLDVSLCLCPRGTHDQEHTCPQCNCPFKSHGDYFAPDDILDTSNRGQQLTCYRCPNSGYYRSDLKSMLFHCHSPREFIVKEYSVEGKHETRFNISIQSEREKMKKFIEYISS